METINEQILYLFGIRYPIERAMYFAGKPVMASEVNGKQIAPERRARHDTALEQGVRPQERGTSAAGPGARPEGEGGSRCGAGNPGETAPAALRILRGPACAQATRLEWSTALEAGPRGDLCAQCQAIPRPARLEDPVRG